MAKTIYNKIKSGKIPVIKKDLEEGVIAEANRDGSIYVDKDVKKNSPLEKEAIAHEKVHLDQMQRGDLDYDDTNVYWKGKKYSRKSMNEGSKQLPWEKEAYNKTKHMKKSKNSAVKMSDADLVANNMQTHKKFQNLGSIAYDAAEEGYNATQERFKNSGVKMIAQPITKKAKSSPLKVDDGTERSKKVITKKAKDIDGNLGTQTITVSGSAPITSYRDNYQGGGTFANQAEKDWYDDQIRQRTSSGMSNEDAIQDYRNTFGIGENKPIKVQEKSGNVDVKDTFEKDVEKNPGKLNPGYMESISGKYAEAVSCLLYTSPSPRDRG